MFLSTALRVLWWVFETFWTPVASGEASCSSPVDRSHYCLPSFIQLGNSPSPQWCCEKGYRRKLPTVKCSVWPISKTISDMWLWKWSLRPKIKMLVPRSFSLNSDYLTLILSVFSALFPMVMWQYNSQCNCMYV